MKIDKNNYELWFIDYYNGNLSGDDIAELMHFLDNNPGLKAEFNEFEELKIVDNNIIIYPDKESLKKKEIVAAGEIDHDNYNDYFIAFHENDLSGSQIENLEKFLDLNPELKTGFNTYKSIKLQYDESIKFTNKEALKKHPFTFLRKPSFYITSAAASVILILGLFLLFNNEEPERYEYSVASLEKRYLNKIMSDQKNERTIISHKIRYYQLANVNPTIEERNELIAPLNQINKELSTEVLALNSTEFLYDFLLPRESAYMINYNLRNDKSLLLAQEGANKERTFLGKIIHNSFTSIKSLFNSSIPELKIDPEKNNTIWNMAKAGIDGYNFFTDNDLELVATVDENGEIVGYALLGDNIQYLKRTKR